MDIKQLLGKTSRCEDYVKVENTAISVGSGTLAVYSTPIMIALMECASKDLVSVALSEGDSTVGIGLNIKHIAATKVGKKVWAIATLKEIDRKRLVFDVDVFDEDKKIGEGTHERFIVNNKKFLSKI